MEAEKYVEMIVRYPKKEVVSVFRTNEEGYLITPEQLKCGTYRIEEVEAPENYVQVGFENVLLKAVSYTHLDVYKRQQKSR